MIELKDVTTGHGGSPLSRAVSFSASGGECILLCGPNGSGKSTLMKTVAGLITPLSGKIISDGRIAMVPTGIPKVSGFTLAEFVRTGAFQDSDLWGRLPEEKERAIGETMRIVGIEELADRDISTLSDGEFQKGCIASAMSRDAGVLLLDEPTAFLDVDSRALVLDALKTVCRKKNTVIIFSSHDIYESSRICSRIFGMTAGHEFLDSAALPEGKKTVVEACFKNKITIFEG